MSLYPMYRSADHMYPMYRSADHMCLMYRSAGLMCLMYRSAGHMCHHLYHRDEAATMDVVFTMTLYRSPCVTAYQMTLAADHCFFGLLLHTFYTVEGGLHSILGYVHIRSQCTPSTIVYFAILQCTAHETSCPGCLSIAAAQDSTSPTHLSTLEYRRMVGLASFVR